MTASEITALTPDDDAAFQTILAFDHIAASGDHERQTELQTALDQGRLHVAWRQGHAVGYYVLAPWWFEASFLQLLYVDATHRRTGIASDLISDARHQVNGRLFTSTNQSNTPMRTLLESLGWTPCGQLEGLDEDDPELFYRID